jgi:O-antigen/teichoic acid export membrane protein
MSDDREQDLLNRRVLINTVMNYIGKIVNLGAWFILTPFILRTLGSTTYGLWALVGSVAAYGTLMDFGVTGTVTKYVAEYRAKNEKDRAGALISTALFIYIILGLTVIIISAALAPIFPKIFNLSPEQHSTGSLLLLLSGLHIGLSIPASTASSILRGLQRFDLMNFTSILSTILSSVSIVVVLLVTGSVIGMMVVMILINLIMLVPSIWFIHRIEPDLRIKWSSINRETARTIFKFSSSLFFIRVGGQMESQSDEIVIGGFMPVSAITPYYIARKLSSMPQLLTDQFLTLLLPLASEIYAVNDMHRLRALFLLSTRLTLAFFLPVGSILIVFSKPILHLWVGEEFIIYAHLVLILTLASLIDTSIWPAGSVIQSMSRHRFTALMAICSGVSNLLLSIVLVQYFGVTGVAMGTLIPTTIICLGFILPFTLRLLNVSIREAIRKIYFPAIWPSIPMIVVMLFYMFFYGSPTILSIGLGAIIGMLVYGIGYLSNTTTTAERYALRTLAIRTFRLAKVYLKFLNTPS